jgi:asparagine synthase (glutamine-hydrolysing)
MCGLAGVLSREPRAANEEVLRKMRDLVAHRGPDHAAVQLVPECGLGLAFARLSVIDPSPAGHQPMWNVERTVSVMLNGEIYNHPELRRQLQELGYHFRSRTDTEVLLHGYQEWGDKVLDRVAGMFALAIVDLRGSVDGQATVLLARDRFGEKPLTYSWDAATGTLVFGSETKAVLAHPSVRRELSSAALHCYLALGYIPSPYTMFRGVHRLRPGHRLVAARGQPPLVETYWRAVPESESPDGRRRRPRREVRALLERSVRERMISDVPLGAFLSGGLDSTIVATLMNGLVDTPLRTFSAAFAVGPRSVKYNADADAAERTARRLGTAHTRLTIAPPENFEGLLRETVWHSDEPHANPTLVTTYLLAREVRRHGVTVILTGDGSDELFGGYPRYQLDRVVASVARLPGSFRRVAEAVARGDRGRNLRTLVEKANLAPFSAPRYMTWWTLFSSSERQALLTSGWRDDVGAPDVLVDQALQEGGPYGSPTEAVMKTDLALWLADESNVRVDKMTMAHALEARAPFQDHDLAMHVLGIPLGERLGGFRFQSKRVLREAFADVLPAESLRRRKLGWLSPVYYWLNDSLWHDAMRLLSHLVEVEILDPSARQLVVERPSRQPRKVWALAILALWYETFVEGR